MGFEPTVELPLHTISSRAPSATRSPLRTRPTRARAFVSANSQRTLAARRAALICQEDALPSLRAGDSSRRSRTRSPRLPQKPALEVARVPNTNPVEAIRAVDQGTRAHRTRLEEKSRIAYSLSVARSPPTSSRLWPGESPRSRHGPADRPWGRESRGDCVPEHAADMAHLVTSRQPITTAPNRNLDPPTLRAFAPPRERVASLADRSCRRSPRSGGVLLLDRHCQPISSASRSLPPNTHRGAAVSEPSCPAVGR